MDGTISDQLLYEWLDISYDLVTANFSKKLRLELDEGRFNA
jgi:predicted DNA-binding protein (MmcQ/YjbR family)